MQRVEIIVIRNGSAYTYVLIKLFAGISVLVHHNEVGRLINNVRYLEGQEVSQ